MILLIINEFIGNPQDPFCPKRGCHLSPNPFPQGRGLSADSASLHCSVPFNGHQSPNGNTLADVFSMGVFRLWAYSLAAVFPMRRSDHEAQPQTIAEEAFGEATERSVK